MFFPMEISCDMGLSQLETTGGFNFMQQWQMMNLAEEVNSIHTSPYVPSVLSSFGQNMEPQFFNNPSAVIDFGVSTKQIGPRSYINTVTGPNGFSHGVGTLQPKQETLFGLSSQKDITSGYKNTSPGISKGKDHVLAERKRREKLSERLIALSTLVPGLKKTDKASILGGTIKYLKHLQEKVKFLEEQASQKTMESVVFVSKSRFSEAAGTDDFAEVTAEDRLPEIEARFSGRNVMIRIHCEKRKGVVETTVAEIEKLHLTLINSSFITFGSNSLHLTIVAQMGMEFSMTAKDVAKSIKSNLDFFMKANIF